METPHGKELTTPPLASLGAEAVTPGLSVDSKVIGMAIERRNTQSAGRCCCQSRSQHNHMRYGEYTITVAASVRPIHVTQIFSVEWREPAYSISAHKSVCGQ